MLSPALTKRLLERFATGAPVVPTGVPEPLTGLTERDLDLVRLVAAGLSNAGGVCAMTARSRPCTP